MGFHAQLTIDRMLNQLSFGTIVTKNHRSIFEGSCEFERSLSEIRLNISGDRGSRSGHYWNLPEYFRGPWKQERSLLRIACGFRGTVEARAIIVKNRLNISGTVEAGAIIIENCLNIFRDRLSPEGVWHALIEHGIPDRVIMEFIPSGITATRFCLSQCHALADANACLVHAASC